MKKSISLLSLFLLFNILSLQIISVFAEPQIFPSPLIQIKGGVPLNKIQCEKEFILAIKSSNGLPVCIKPDTALKLMERGWLKEYSLSKTNNNADAVRSDLGRDVIQPGPPPEFLCLAQKYHVFSTSVLSTIGFDIYKNSGFENYVIEPGQKGYIDYNITRSYQTKFKDIEPTKIRQEFNLTTVPLFIHQKNNNSINTHLGIVVSSQPTSKILGFNDTVTVSLTFTVDKNTNRGTYWLVLPPGGCNDGKILLLTIGKLPYSKIN